MVVTSKKTMKQANVRFNYDDYLQLPEDKRYEILEGELYVVPAPNIRHQRASKRILTALIRQIEEKDLGEVFSAPSDVVLSEENVVQPDLLLVRKERAGIIGESHIRGAPDLVVEITSPGTRQRDLAIKRKIYARFGVPEYWIVDPDANTIEVLVLIEAGYRSESVFTRSDTLNSPLFPSLRLQLTDVFQPL